MPVPGAARVAEAVELLRPSTGEHALVAAYRLLRVELTRQRGHVGHVEPWLDEGAAGRALSLLRVDEPGCGRGAEPDADVAALAELHQQLLRRRRRRATGVWYTPRPLVEHLLDEALEPTLDEVTCEAQVTVLDPACGSGLFLVAALRRFLRRGVEVDQALDHCLHGVELDPAAAELAGLSLWLTAVDATGRTDLPQPGIEVGDALQPGARRRHDVVVGNPPFLNRLERRTAQDRETGRRLAAESGCAVGPYTDLSAVFLHRAAGWVRPGGRVGLVQPQSLLAARDASGVRAELHRTCALESLWSSDVPLFDAGVLTCAPVLRAGGVQQEVRRADGPRFRTLASLPAGDLAGTWSHLVAGSLGVPQVWARSAGVVDDVAHCTADFRDQYYGLAGHVHEASDLTDGTPLVTTGMIDPARNAWGEQPTRFLKKRWSAPVVDLASLSAEPTLSRWARARLVPKVLVGTQGKLLEAVVDEQGAWLPSVPTITVVPREVSLWRLLAVLLAPPVAAHAATVYAGAGLTLRAIKLSARQVAGLPLPGDADAWARAADHAEAAQHDPSRRLEHLEAMGRLMCAAYDVQPDLVMPWWVARLR
jgi:tRNA1(Val) A37 N6-methylase TrmN6